PLRLPTSPTRRSSDLLDGHPEIDYDWDTVESYLGRFDGAVGPNIAFVVGNSALRLSTIGWDEVEADEHAVRSMRSMLAEAMQERSEEHTSELQSLAYL